MTASLYLIREKQSSLVLKTSPDAEWEKQIGLALEPDPDIEWEYLELLLFPHGFNTPMLASF